MFSVRSGSTEGMRSALKEISHTIQANSHAHVVFVDCIVDGRVQMQHLYAPDGRGWTGNEAMSDATLPLPKNS